MFYERHVLVSEEQAKDRRRRRQEQSLATISRQKRPVINLNARTLLGKLQLRSGRRGAQPNAGRRRTAAGQAGD